MSLLSSDTPRMGLAHKVVAALRQRIIYGNLVPGDKLPTEHKLIEEFGVSRTVIREAISGLKAEGLLSSRQGAGVFILPPKKQIQRRHCMVKTPKQSPV